MPIELHRKEELITAAIATRRPVAFLVGSPLSLKDGIGVPGVAEMIGFIRDEIRDHVSFALPRLEIALNGKSGADAYQEAMRWLGVNAGQDAINTVIERAVLQARKATAPELPTGNGQPRDWDIPAGTAGLGELVARGGEKFLGPILTTNFDPLLSLAIRGVGGQTGRRVLTADGTLAGRAEEDICTIVHLHGFWRESDTLHTQAQLTNPRPKLKASLQRLVQQRTLIVAAYGGWDDVFTQALVELMNDEQAPLDVIWCFNETDSTDVEGRYGKLLAAVSPAIGSNRFRAFGGIDCHSIFTDVLSTLREMSPAPVAAAIASPLAAWEQIDASYLISLPVLSHDELIRYFDGAVPTWRHAVSPTIPRRQAVSEISSRLATFEPGKGGCSLQLIRAAGGEGKTTLLLQAASDAARSGAWNVLWRPSSHVRLPAEHLVRLDADKQWLIVADDAENLVGELSESARFLYEAGRSNVHFLLAARDADWWAKFGDKPPWEMWLEAWVRRDRAIKLRGLNREEAKDIVEAWTRCGADGLRDLANLSGVDEQVTALVGNVQDAVPEQDAQMARRTPIEGSFFGGLLAVRFGQNGLQAHVRAFLNRLKEDPIEGSSHTLFDALIYVAACHAVGIHGLDENVLADLVGVPRDWIQSLVVRPLGEEAAAVQSASHVLTRHSKVASAILVEADQTLDVAEVWSAVVRQTVRTSKRIRMDRRWFPWIIHAGPLLQEALPQQLSEQRRAEIAIAAAKADIAVEPDRLCALVDLGKTYRTAKNFAGAVQVFRDNLASAHTKVDFAEVIRGYFHEWGVVEGIVGHAASSAWLGGLSLSDYQKVAPITDYDVKVACSGLGLNFGKLAQSLSESIFARGRRAAVHIGRFTNPDPTATRYFDMYDREANRIGIPHPKNDEEAVGWLTAAVAQAGRELKDPFLMALLKPDHVSFNRLRHFFAFAIPTSTDVGATANSVTQKLLVKAKSSKRFAAISETVVDRLDSSPAPEQKTTGKGDLRYGVWMVISDLIDRSISQQRPLLLTGVGYALVERFPDAKPIHRTLGFETLTDFILSFDDFTVAGEHPQWLVQYREGRQTTGGGDLRYGVWMVISDLIDRSISQQRPLLLAEVGYALVERFPEAKPILRTLGFETLTNLILSFDDFVVTGEHPRWLVEYQEDQKTTGIGDLRYEVWMVISDLMDRNISEQRPLYLPAVGLELGERFPEAKPVHHSLGFATLTDLILSFDDFSVTGDHPRWLVQYRGDGAKKLRKVPE